MKYYIALTLCICGFGNAYSQFSEKFGMLSVDEMNVKECSFDPEANAIVLLHEGSADYDFIRDAALSPDNPKLHIRMRIELSKSFYDAEEYPDIQEFYKKMINLLNEQVVLKMK